MKTPVIDPSATLRPRDAQLIAVTGPPCSGKSTLARLIALRANTIWLDVDEIRLELLPDSRQTRADRDCAYRCMHLTARKLIEGGIRRVVLAATYGRREPRLWLESLVAVSGAQPCIVQCQIDPEIAVARFRHRRSGHAAIDLTEKSVRRQTAQYAYDGGIIVDTTRSTDECVEQIELALSEGTVPDLSRWIAGGLV